MVNQMKCNVIFSNPRGTTIFLKVYKYSDFCSFFSHNLEQAKNFKINTFHLECTNILGSGEPLGRIYENPNQVLRYQSIHLGRFRSIHKRFKYMKKFRNISLNPNIYNSSLTVSMHNSST